MSEQSMDFIKLLLAKNPEERLGAKEGLYEILSHPWLASFRKEDLENKSLAAPFKPNLTNNIEDVTNFDKEFSKEEVAVSVITNPKDLLKIKKRASDFENF